MVFIQDSANKHLEIGWPGDFTVNLKHDSRVQSFPQFLDRLWLKIGQYVDSKIHVFTIARRLSLLVFAFRTEPPAE